MLQILNAQLFTIASMPSLTPDELLTTTRAVRRRLDLSRPVGRKVIEECIHAALQAPNAGNRQKIHFVVVTEEKKRASLADIYRKGSAEYFKMRWENLAKGSGNPAKDAAEKRVMDSAWYLHEHLHEVPVHIVPCISGRTDGMPAPDQAARWGTIFPAAWSFMLAGRARGLGTTFTTLHLNCEKEAAELLGIPFEEVMQAGLLPVAYTKGADFRPAARPPVSEIIHWDGW
jgi:nitroreductase